MLPCENSKSGSVRGFQRVHKPYFEPFSVIFCLFLQFSTLESCYIWFSISLEYPNASLYCFCPRKIQNWGLSGGHFGLLSMIFVNFFNFLHWNHKTRKERVWWTGQKFFTLSPPFALVKEIQGNHYTAVFYKKGVCPFFEKSQKLINLFILIKMYLF